MIAIKEAYNAALSERRADAVRGCCGNLPGSLG
jgi:hypothetical protein